jgi:hypothetical protein
MTLRDDVELMATKLARSGEHANCLTIEAELAHKGFPEAYVVLVDPTLRARLDALCNQARPSQQPDMSK